MSSYLLINNKYVLGKQLGVGSFGEIYLGIDKDKNKNSEDKVVAIKLEHREKDLQLLNWEANVYKYLYANNKGLPKIYWNGIQDDYNVLVMQMLGPNLENLLNLCGQHFSLKTTLLIAMDMLQKMQYIHSKGIIHRDIKPENFLIGLNNNEIHVIDFGLAKRFKNSDGSHIPFSDNKKMVGTVRYSSINTHIGIELSRRDDLESIGYLLIYFIKGVLPWQKLGPKGISREQRYRLIYECKKNTTIEQLCQGLPKEFKLYMQHVKSLEFNEKPNYQYLYELFSRLFEKKKYIYDDEYDWIHHKK